MKLHGNVWIHGKGVHACVCVCVFRGRAGGQLYHYTLNAWASIDAVVTLYFHCSCCRCSCWGLPAAAAAAAAIAIAVQQDNLFGSNIAAFRHLLAALGHSLISITYANIHPNAELNTELINCNFIRMQNNARSATRKCHQSSASERRFLLNFHKNNFIGFYPKTYLIFLIICGLL